MKKIHFWKTKSSIKKLTVEEQIDSRIAVLEMLLWKHHKEGIPVDVCERLVQNGFLVRTERESYIWTQLSDELSKKFNNEFNYNC